jgi:hypothetical protein
LRFTRTIRVKANTALAEHQLRNISSRQLRSSANFIALAARADGDWRFPEDGLMDDEGLLIAQVKRSDAGHIEILVLQAQGAAGLDFYQDCDARVTTTDGVIDKQVSFDQNGTAILLLEAEMIEESIFADLKVVILGNKTNS